MIAWESNIDGTIFYNKEEARDFVREQVGFDEIASQVGNNITYEDLVQELAKFDSELFYQLCNEAEEELFDTIISTIEVEEDQ